MCVIWTFLLPTAKRKKVERIKCQRGTIANETVAMTTLGVILKEEPPVWKIRRRGRSVTHVSPTHIPRVLFYLMYKRYRLGSKMLLGV
jgi:hypothetical protein